jgi:hypothetical protein
MITDRRKLEAVLRGDFRAFVRKSFGTLSPGQAFTPARHIEAIAYRLESVRTGETRRLIINMPPRSLKSITASVAFPAFAPFSKRPGIGRCSLRRASAPTGTRKRKSS